MSGRYRTRLSSKISGGGIELERFKGQFTLSVIEGDTGTRYRKIRGFSGENAVDIMENTVKEPQAKGTVAERAEKYQDKRYKLLETAMKRHQYQHDSLLEVLHTAQELFGYLEDDLLIYVANSLKLPPSHVFGVVTFYHYFLRKPQGRHTCLVCMGTACYVKGADKILSGLEEHYGICAGETTPDDEVTLIKTRCIGACGLAPAVIFDQEVTGRQTPESVSERIKKWTGNGSR